MCRFFYFTSLAADYIFPKAGRFRRLWRPGSSRHGTPVPPAERAGSEGREKVLKIDGAFAPRVLKFDSGCAAEGYGGGWRRKHIRCLSAAVVDAFKNERRHDDKTGEPPCGRSSVVWFSIPRSGIIKLIARRAIPQPSGQQGLSNFRTLRTFGPPGPSTLTPQACPLAIPQPSALKGLSNLRTLRPARACQTSGPLGPLTLTPTGVSLHPFRNWPISLTGRV